MTYFAGALENARYTIKPLRLVLSYVMPVNRRTIMILGEVIMYRDSCVTIRLWHVYTLQALNIRRVSPQFASIGGPGYWPEVIVSM